MGEAGPTNSWWYDAATSVNLDAQTVTEYTFDNWDVDGTSKGSGVNPISVSMNGPHTATAHYSAVSPPLSISINPLSKTILEGESVTFTSTASGGTGSYTYQWYLDDSPVSGATSSSWTFTPPDSGIYYVYLQVTDSASNTVQSATAKVTVQAQIPVGGYTVSLQRANPTSMLAVYGIIVALFAVALSMPKRKRK